MWQIAFFVADSSYHRGLTDGQWAVGIALRENSTTTTVSATYVIEQHAPDDAPTSLELSGKLSEEQTVHIALPDAIQYP